MEVEIINKDSLSALFVWKFQMSAESAISKKMFFIVFLKFKRI